MFHEYNVHVYCIYSLYSKFDQWIFMENILVHYSRNLIPHIIISVVGTQFIVIDIDLDRTENSVRNMF